MDKFQRAVLIAVLLVVFIAYMDTKGFVFWQQLGGFSGENFEKGKQEYMLFFWTFAYALIAVIALAYYYLVRRDVSETVAISATSFLLLSGGLEDALYYILQGKSIDATLPWLNSHWFMGAVGQGCVTRESLIFSIIISVLITYVLIKYLRRAKW